MCYSQTDCDAFSTSFRELIICRAYLCASEHIFIVRLFDRLQDRGNNGASIPQALVKTNLPI